MLNCQLERFYRNPDKLLSGISSPQVIYHPPLRELASGGARTLIFDVRPLILEEFRKATPPPPLITRIKPGFWRLQGKKCYLTAKWGFFKMLAVTPRFYVKGE